MLFQMNSYGQIIAIGGGGFGRNPNKPVIEEYILELSNTAKPRIAFFPTASLWLSSPYTKILKI